MLANEEKASTAGLGGKVLKVGEQIYEPNITPQFVIAHTAMLEDEPYRKSDDWSC